MTVGYGGLQLICMMTRCFGEIIAKWFLLQNIEGVERKMKWSILRRRQRRGI